MPSRQGLCYFTKTLPVSAGFTGIQLPTRCDNVPVGGSEKDCPLDPYVIIHDKSSFIDQQTLKLQETPESVPVGEMPRHLLVTADRYAVNAAIPGSRVTITGIFDSFKGKSAGKNVAVRHTYLRVIGMQAELDGSSRAGRAYTEAEEDEFIKMAREPNFYERFTASVAPSIYGHPGIVLFLTSRHQKGDYMSATGRLKEALAR